MYVNITHTRACALSMREFLWKKKSMFRTVFYKPVDVLCLSVARREFIECVCGYTYLSHQQIKTPSLSISVLIKPGQQY